MQNFCISFSNKLVIRDGLLFMCIDYISLSQSFLKANSASSHDELHVCNLRYKWKCSMFKRHFQKTISGIRKHISLQIPRSYRPFMIPNPSCVEQVDSGHMTHCVDGEMRLLPFSSSSVFTCVCVYILSTTQHC